MFEKEEEKLLDYKNQYDNIDVSEEALDAAIMAGFHRAKLEEIPKKRKNKMWFTLTAAAIILVSFLTSVRLSPAFADYVAVIPGMEKLVEIIRNDKGKMQAFESDYFEKIGVSEEKNGLMFTLDGIITDENGLLVFYSIHSKEKQNEVMVQDVQLKSLDGQELDFSYTSYGRPLQAKDGKTFGNDYMEFFFESPMKAREFELNFKIKGEKQTEDFSIQFKVKKEIQKKKSYVLNKSIVLEGQKVTVEKAEVYPLRVAIHLEMDSTNTKRLLNFDDIRLVDENGEVWNKIADGVTATFKSDDEVVVYLQSNYFRDPKELYLVINKIQAVDKKEERVIIDTVEKKIVKQPKENLLSEVVVQDERVVVKVRTEKEFNYFIFAEVTDKEGNVLFAPEKSIAGPYDGYMEFGVLLPGLSNELSPISLKLTTFPSWIKGDTTLKIK